jgi:hypothetical protein
MPELSNAFVRSAIHGEGTFQDLNNATVNCALKIGQVLTS